jgi:hypothetical protein
MYQKVMGSTTRGAQVSSPLSGCPSQRGISGCFDGKEPLLRGVSCSGNWPDIEDLCLPSKFSDLGLKNLKILRSNVNSALNAIDSSSRFSQQREQMLRWYQKWQVIIGDNGLSRPPRHCLLELEYIFLGVANFTTDTPVWYSSAVSKSVKVFEVPSSLNGSNGEWTNTDDFDHPIWHMDPAMVLLKSLTLNDPLTIVNANLPHATHALTMRSFEWYQRAEDEERLLFWKILYKRFRALHPACQSQLNGANGEWTGDDDRPRGQNKQKPKPKPKPKGRAKMIVVKRTVEGPRVTKNTKRTKIHNKLNMNSSWAQALCNPFSRIAEGAGICDQWRIPTTKAVVHGELNWGINANATCYLMCMPSPMVSFQLNLSANGSISGYNSVLNSTSSQALYTGTSLTNMASTWASYRLVCGGVLLRSLFPSTSMPGRVTGFQCPVTGECPPYSVLASSTFVTNDSWSNAMVGFLQASTGTQILGMRDVQRFTTADFMLDGWLIPFQPSDSRCYDFHPLTEATSGTGVGGSAALFTGEYAGEYVVATNASTPVINYTGSAAAVDMRGWGATMLSCQTGTNSGNITIEYIYRLECIADPINAAGLIVSAPDQNNKKHSKGLADAAIEILKDSMPLAGKILQNLALGAFDNAMGSNLGSSTFKLLEEKNNMLR